MKTMVSNNFFLYLEPEANENDIYIAFVLYLLSFAAEEHRQKDPALTACAKELICTMIGTDPEDVTVTDIVGIDNDRVSVIGDRDYPLYIKVVSVNRDRQIYIGPDFEKEDPILIPREAGKPVSYVWCSNDIDVVDTGIECFRLTGKKLLEICEKYRSANQVYCAYLEVLRDRERRYGAYLTLPMDAWDTYAGKGFFSHLVTAQIIDGFKNLCVFYNAFQTMPCFVWYSVSHASLASMKVERFVREIYIYACGSRIFVCVGATEHSDAKNVAAQMADFLSEYGSELREMERGFLPLLSPVTDPRGYTVLEIPYDMGNYKEKFQYAQSIIDRLEAEFKL